MAKSNEGMAWHRNMAWQRWRGFLAMAAALMCMKTMALAEKQWQRNGNFSETNAVVM